MQFTFNQAQHQRHVPVWMLCAVSCLSDFMVVVLESNAIVTGIKSHRIALITARGSLHYGSLIRRVIV